MRFMLEIVGPDRIMLDRKEIRVDAESDIWGRVAAVARRMKDLPHARIRVLDGEGGIVVLTSVVAALLVEVRPAA